MVVITPHWHRAQLSYRGSTNTGVLRCTPAKFFCTHRYMPDNRTASGGHIQVAAPHGLRSIAPFWPPDSIQESALWPHLFWSSYWDYFSQLADDLSSHWVYLSTFGTLITFSHFSKFPISSFSIQKKVSPCWTSDDSYLKFLPFDTHWNLIHIELGFWRYPEQELLSMVVLMKTKNNSDPRQSCLLVVPDIPSSKHLLVLEKLNKKKYERKHFVIPWAPSKCWSGLWLL